MMKELECYILSPRLVAGRGKPGARSFREAEVQAAEASVHRISTLTLNGYTHRRVHQYEVFISAALHPKPLAPTIRRVQTAVCTATPGSARNRRRRHGWRSIRAAHCSIYILVAGLVAHARLSVSSEKYTGEGAQMQQTFSLRGKS